MRPCLSDQIRLQADALQPEDFAGATYVLLSGYGFYGQDFPERAAAMARAAGAKVAMDLASFEVVRRSRPRLEAMLNGAPGERYLIQGRCVLP